MRFLEDSDVDDEFRGYLREIVYYHEEDRIGKLEEFVKAKLLNLIVWRGNGEIVGHAIWHESNTAEHRKGDPRDKEDHEILEKLLGGKKEFVELHEVWLLKEHRRKGFGKLFFEFFEQSMRKRGYDTIVYYAYHHAAITICRRRGYKEAYGIEEIGLEGEKETCYVFSLSLEQLGKRKFIAERPDQNRL